MAEAVETDAEDTEEREYERPEVIWGTTWRVPTGCGSLFVTVNFDGGRVVETIIHMGKAGGCSQAQTEALGRVLTMGSRQGVEPDEMIRQLRGVACHRPRTEDGRRVLSCGDAIGIAIEKAVMAGDPASGN